jgi:hypothetical protein
MTTDGSAFKFEPAEITVKVSGTVKWVSDSDNRPVRRMTSSKTRAGGLAIRCTALGLSVLTMESFEQSLRCRESILFCRNHGQFGMEAVITSCHRAYFQIANLVRSAMQVGRDKRPQGKNEIPLCGNLTYLYDYGFFGGFFTSSASSIW